MNPIGIMQGRLLPPSDGKIQSFPAARWTEEFELARQAGLHCIEWIYEKPNEEKNPVRTDSGIEEMLRLSGASGVQVKSICADYYMTEHLVTKDGASIRTNVDHLIWLIGQGGKLGINYIVLPFVDSSSLASEAEFAALADILVLVLPAAEANRIELHLETDFTPKVLRAFLDRIGHPLVKANYDIGNCASLGHDPNEELVLLKDLLGSVHVKDRVLGGGTVPLGTGSADFETCFRLFNAAGFSGPYILQAARQDGMTEVELAVQNRKLVERFAKN
ncbi:MAG: sugar phosphate isomerase/epimerase family protein [Solirubrobacterales bacterium]